MYDNTTILLIALSFTIAFAAILLTLMFIYKSMKESRYNAEKNRAEIESVRKSLENRIYSLTDRLVSSESRWKDVNHLLLSSVKHSAAEEVPVTDVPYTHFIKSFGMSKRDLSVQNDLVFVLTPFHPDYENTFTIIAEICRKVGLRCYRGDEQQVTSDLLAHILQFIVRARLIIANIDGRNPNVFYELGIAHALDKPTILISSSVSDLPFDLKTKKIIIYKTHSELQDQLKTELTRSLLKIQSKESPSSDAINPQLQIRPVAFTKDVPKKGQGMTTIELLNYSDSPAFNLEFDLKYGSNDWIKAWNRARVKELEKIGDSRTAEQNNELNYRKEGLYPLKKLDPGMVAKVQVTGAVPDDICEKARVNNEFLVLLKVEWHGEKGRVFERIIEYGLLCTKVGTSEDYSFLSGRIVSEK